MELIRQMDESTALDIMLLVDTYSLSNVLRMEVLKFIKVSVARVFLRNERRNAFRNVLFFNRIPNVTK